MRIIAVNCLSRPAAPPQVEGQGTKCLALDAGVIRKFPETADDRNKHPNPPKLPDGTTGTRDTPPKPLPQPA